MAKSIENLKNAFDEMFDFITDLPSGLDGFESDFDSAFEELRELKATLTPPNEALICDGCLWAEMGALEKCSSCMRDKKDNYYRRPPEGEENHDGLRKAD